MVESAERNTLLFAELEAALKGAGYVVALPGAGAKAGHRLRFGISESDGGVLLRLELDGVAVCRWYPRDDHGRLVGAGRQSVQRGEDEESEVLTEPTAGVEGYADSL